MGNGASVDMIAKMPRLRVLQSLSSGVDNVLGSVPEQVALCNGSGLHHEESTAELAVSLILASLRQLPQFARNQMRRRWQHVRTDSLDGKRVLLVGYGGMGKAIEDRLAPFGARVTRCSRTARDGVAPLSQLARLAAGADILVVCIALAPETCGLIGEEVLAAMPDGALVVNVARGPIVDAVALVGHLSDGRLRAALDVTDPEPLPPGHPLWSAPGLLLTPHVGGSVPLAVDRAFRIAAEQIRQFAGGNTPSNLVKDGY
jgi:phosphoglycerate dehydrogenase-like enzyme